VSDADSYDLVVIGMGSAGLTAAEFAAGLGLRVAAVERHRLGGDCLWTGCVPSKALLASAKVAHAMRHADRFGIRAVEPDIDLASVWRRIRHVQSEIATTDDDPARYRSMGVEVIHGTARLTGADEVTVTTGDGAGPARTLSTRFVLVCTGSRPDVPDIPGLADVGPLTNENLFDLDRPPSSMVVIGGGPIGVELAQGLVRLGVPTTIVELGTTVLGRDEPSLVTRLVAVLRRDGVDVRTGLAVSSVRLDGDDRVVTLSDGTELRAAGVLVATGRRPNVDELGLADLGVETNERGIVVDGRGRTSVRSVYAAGDVAGRYLFTHAAGHEAARAVRDMFFPGRGGAVDLVPWCTFTDPELAHVGLTVAEAEREFGTDTEVWRADLAHHDRTRADGATDGAIVIVTAKDRVVGAHVLAPSAGEVIHELSLAVRDGTKLSDLADLVHVYPTVSTAVGRLAAEAAYERAHRLRWLLKRR
jgi:pyruvate/2-oxoglutarate dehydrogenase complex dihydrolipoamide dehydrogenase (E3) component